MTERYYYLALEEDQRLVTDWFAALAHAVTVDENADRVLYYFRDMAKEPPASSVLNQSRMPLVFLTKPQKRLGTLWTDAQVLFTPTPFRSQFPHLFKVHKAFGSWLRQFPLVFAQKSGSISDWNYYLEGSIRNYASELYALPNAMKALGKGQYFVHHRDRLTADSQLARTLRLRGYGVEGT
jgi:hypothetical protein